MFFEKLGWEQACRYHLVQGPVGQNAFHAMHLPFGICNTPPLLITLQRLKRISNDEGLSIWLHTHPSDHFPWAKFWFGKFLKLNEADKSHAPTDSCHGGSAQAKLLAAKFGTTTLPAHPTKTEHTMTSKRWTQIEPSKSCTFYKNCYILHHGKGKSLIRHFLWRVYIYIALSFLGCLKLFGLQIPNGVLNQTICSFFVGGHP